MCAMKAVYTGPDVDLHALIELCVLPVNVMLEPHTAFPLFHMRCRPEDNEIWEVNKYLSKQKMSSAILRGTPRQKMAGYFEEWYKEIGLREKKRIVPLIYDWATNKMMLERWLGHEQLKAIFADNARDVLTLAVCMNDMYDMRAEPPFFRKTNWEYLISTYDIEHLERRTAASDCLSLIKLYKAMLQTFKC